MTAGRILVVDDEVALTFFLQQTLLAKNAERYTVQTATSGKEALRHLQDQSYDLLITDQKMPGMDGLQLIAAARQIAPQLRVILMTAYDSAEVMEQAQKLRVFRYITKPFYVDDLRQAVREALEEQPAAEAAPPTAPPQRREELAVADPLRELQASIGCQYVCLTDMAGQIIGEVGRMPGLDTPALAATIASRFAATFEMARLLGSDNAYNLDFHEGQRYDVYSANVGSALILTSVFDRQVQPSKLGSVWHYTKRTISGLLTRMPTGELAGEGPGRVEAAAPPAPARRLRPPASDMAPAVESKPARRKTPPTPWPEPVSEVEEPALSDTGRRQLFNLDQARALGLLPEGFDFGDASDESSDVMEE